jgi:hypothetical protein
MSYPEKRNIVSIVTGVLILAAYCIHSFGKVQAGVVAPDDLKFWAGAMLIFIGIGIAASIIIQIIFHIFLSVSIAVKKTVQEEDCDEKKIEKSIQAEMVEDEMDKLIERKAMQVGFIFAGVGFVSGLLALLLDYSAAVMLNTLFISFSVGSIFEGFTRLYYYRKGV